ncbi:MAG: glutamate racemase, partial [Bdellovibrio sp.]|nr:glutamate racemase [Bdellovibrio sp.]
MTQTAATPDTRPIGVFDSGIGGMTVLKELIRVFPHENFIYLGDTARLPYGSKSGDTVRKYSVQNMNFLISRDVKAIVVACNTASTQIFENEFQGIPVYNVIDPGAKLAAAKTENNKVAVLGTRATIKAATYTRKIKEHRAEIEVFAQACPLFVPLAEEGWHDDPVTNLIAFRYLQNLKTEDVDTVVLACTHYPLLKIAIAKVFGNHVHLIDSGEAIAAELLADIKNGRVPANTPETHTQLQICLTDSGEQFENLSLRLLAEVTDIQPVFETVSVI